jgi:hypothetical protein
LAPLAWLAQGSRTCYATNAVPAHAATQPAAAAPGSSLPAPPLTLACPPHRAGLKDDASTGDAQRGRRAAAQRVNFAEMAKGPTLPTARPMAPGTASRRPTSRPSSHRDAYSDAGSDDYCADQHPDYSRQAGAATAGAVYIKGRQDGGTYGYGPGAKDARYQALAAGHSKARVQPGSWDGGYSQRRAPSSPGQHISATEKALIAAGLHRRAAGDILDPVELEEGGGAARVLGGTTGQPGRAGRCAVCVIQRKGKCGTESAPKKCLRRQLAALSKHPGKGGSSGGTAGAAASPAAASPAAQSPAAPAASTAAAEALVAAAAAAAATSGASLALPLPPVQQHMSAVPAAVTAEAAAAAAASGLPALAPAPAAEQAVAAELLPASAAGTAQAGAAAQQAAAGSQPGPGAAAEAGEGGEPSCSDVGAGGIADVILAAAEAVAAQMDVDVE